MNFIRRLFTCGCTEDNEKATASASSLCVKRKPRPSGDISVSVKSITSSTHPNSATIKREPLEVKNIKKRPLPQFTFVNCQDLRKERGQEIDYGFLVGAINLSKKATGLLDSDLMVVEIGEKQEINTLSAMRPGSLDCLVAIWNEEISQFSKEELLVADQRLVLVF